MQNKAEIIKVVGTTFRPLPQDKYIKITGKPFTFKDDIPAALTNVVLMPEPSNEFDPDAVQVVAELTDGSAYHIGYVGKDDPWKLRITAPTLATMRIVNFTEVGNYNPSYSIIDIQI